MGAQLPPGRWDTRGGGLRWAPAGACPPDGDWELIGRVLAEQHRRHSSSFSTGSQGPQEHVFGSWVAEKHVLPHVWRGLCVTVGRGRKPEDPDARPTSDLTSDQRRQGLSKRRPTGPTQPPPVLVNQDFLTHSRSRYNWHLWQLSYLNGGGE